MHEFCLHLLCPPAAEEQLLDSLLGSAANEVFTSTQVQRHGMASARLSAAEQVLGSSRSVHLQVLLGKEELQRLLAMLQRDFAGAGIRYWVSPIAFEGEIK